MIVFLRFRHNVLILSYVFVNMEQDLYQLSKRLRQDRNQIIECVRQTARIHKVSVPVVIKVLKNIPEVPPPKKTSPKKTSPKKTSPKKTPKGPTYEDLVRRAKKVGIKNFIKRLESAKTEQERTEIALEALKWIENPKLYTEEDAWEVYGEVAPFVRGKEVRNVFVRLLLKNGVSPLDLGPVILEDDPPSVEDRLEWFKIGAEIKRNQLSVPDPTKTMREIGTMLWNISKDKEDRQTIVEVLM